MQTAIEERTSKKPGAALAVLLVGSTVAVSPWFSYDPINLPKLVVLATTSFYLIPYLLKIRSPKKGKKTLRTLIAFILLFNLFSIISLSVTGHQLSQQFWGTWGRSNGLLSYFSLTILMLACVRFSFEGNLPKIFRFLVIGGYATASYSLIQYMDLDPIDWSLKQPFAFLGNINFMSSFLGLVNIYLVTLIFQKDSSISSRIFFVLLSISNFFIVFFTGSIQGIGVMAVGMSIYISLQLYRKKSKIVAFLFLSLVSVLGIVTLLGTAGFGPLGQRIVQQTVLFRIDYWKAGIAIFLDNFWFGVGLDSLGDFYREYRDEIAATRTGPNRVVNTSHNVFIDLFANGGIFVGGCFIAIVGIVLFAGIKSIKNHVNAEDSVILLSLISGWLFFLSISINQIGVTVWGFAFMGALVGVYLRSKRNSENKTSGTFTRNRPDGKLSKESPVLTKLKENFIALAFSLVGFGIASIPLNVDARFLSAYRSGNSSEMARLIQVPGSMGFHEDKYLEFLWKGENGERILSAARQLAGRNPRNVSAWRTISELKGIASTEERKNALEVWLRLDPENESIIEALSELESP
jgi:O-antigen ligase